MFLIVIFSDHWALKYEGNYHLMTTEFFSYNRNQARSTATGMYGYGYRFVYGFKGEIICENSIKVSLSKSNKSQAKLEKYKNGKSFTYDPNKKHKTSYVGCHYLNLQEELHEECGLSKRMWSGFVMVCLRLHIYVCVIIYVFL